MGDLSRWKNTRKRSHYNGWPTHVKKYIDFSEKGLIVIGDLHKGKKNAKNFSSGLIVLGNLPNGERKKKECEEFCKWSIYSKRLVQLWEKCKDCFKKNTKIFQK